MVDYIKYIREYLFKDVYEFAGKFRNVDFSKHEKILNNDSVAYDECKLLDQSLEYDTKCDINLQLYYRNKNSLYPLDYRKKETIETDMIKNKKLF